MEGIGRVNISWMIYGANGYTGELIAREAVRRGLRSWLVGPDLIARLPGSGPINVI